MITFIVFFLILSLLVLIHEFGHFITAKRFGIKVEEFGFGLPPRLIGKQKGETVYSINALPFGGFVKLLGEDADDEKANLDPRSFGAKNPWKRAIILVAGVSMNLLLGVVIYYTFFSITNFKSLTIPLLYDHNFSFGQEKTVNTVVSGFSQESLADEAGVRSGEAILEINNVPVYTLDDVKAQLKTKPNQKVKLLLMDVVSLENKLRTVEVTTISGKDGEGLLGVGLSKAVTLSYQGRYKALAGFYHAYNIMSYSASTFGNILKDSVKQKDATLVSSSVSGPIGIFGVVGSILEYGGKEAVLGIMDLTAILSLSLAFLNIMPFPALDGGRLVFVIFEGLTRKKPSQRLETTIHKWGMLFLLLLIALVTVKDLTSIFGS